MPIRSTICFLMCSLCLAFSAKAQKSSTDFVSTWVTDRADLKVINDSSIIIFVNPAYAYKFDIDWENDGIFDDTSVTTNIQHQYPRLDTFTIRIRGTFPHIYFGRQPGNSPKLLAIEQWGDYHWKSMEESFSYTNMWINDTLPIRLDSVLSCEATFRNSIVNADVSNWDVSGVIDMSRMFKSAKQFNQDISGWDVSAVQFMEQMFMDADQFDQNLNSWDVSNVISMAGMFKYAGSFDQPLDQWDVSRVNDMNDLFFDAGSFNQDLSMWNVSNVVDMSGMFAGTQFNYDLNSWDVSNVKDMSRMFQTPAFNGRIDQWDVSQVEDMRLLFSNAETFDQDISNWDVSQVRDMSLMFNRALSFNQDLGNWQVDSVRSFAHMFQEAVAFDQDIGSWQVAQANDFRFMFQEASSFNQNLSAWDMSNAEFMTRMFIDAVAFDQDLSAWDIDSVVNMFQMLNRSGLSLVNYDSTLIGWALQDVRSGVELGAEDLIFCDADSARQTLIDRGWIIEGDTLDCPVGLFENSSINALLYIYPNPSNGVFQLKGIEDTPLQMHLFDLQGRLVRQYDPSEASWQLPVESGIYLLRLELSDGVWVQEKVVRE